MIRLLESLDEATRRGVISASTRRRFRKGETLFHEGDPGDTLHLIDKGHVAIRVSTALGETATLAVLGPGSSFGEQALLTSESRRTASAVALDQVETLALHRNDVEALRGRVPHVDRLLVLVLAEQVRRLSGQVVDARHASVPVRVARVLRELVAVWGARSGTIVEIPLTQEDLASLVGITRPTMNRALQELVDRDVVELARGKLRILDVEALASRAR